MKNLYKNIALGLSVATIVTFTSCQNDFLDKYPPDAFSEPSYFKTDEELSFFANRFYGDLPVAIIGVNDDNSDNMAPKTANSFLADNYTIPTAGGGWSEKDWNPIRNCNFFLENYQRVQTSTREIYAGEVRFFRALYYWRKVVRFGDVPLILNKVGDASPEIFGPRENRSKVMDQVLADIDFAVENLPEKSAAAAGRLHKDAALAFKSRVALWEGTFRKYHNLGNYEEVLRMAVDASEKLMNKGYQLYSTNMPNQDYRDLFIKESLADNPEAIFYRRYSRTTEKGKHQYSRHAKGANTGCSKDFMEAYLFSDGKPIMGGGSTHNYDDSSPENEAMNRDPRYAQTVATVGFVKTSSEPPVVVQLPEIGTATTSTGYWFIKGMSSDPAQEEAYSSDTDGFVFRYAEILLNYAEAKYELQGNLSQDDLDKSINKIRARVDMPKLTLGQINNGTNKVNYGYEISDLLYEIRRERRVELVGEGFRFKDILRWKAGTLINNPKTVRGMKLTDELKARYATAGRDVNNIQVDDDKYMIIYPTILQRTWKDKMYLYPIPTDEVTLVKYTQNPGWE